jgi:hypothetical protein
MTASLPKCPPDSDDDLSPKQDLAIRKLIEGGSHIDAARVSGVTSRTVRRWMNEPLFTAQLREAQTRLRADLLGALEREGMTAIRTLAKAMVGKRTAAGVRVRAALGVLGLVLKSPSSGDEDLDTETDRDETTGATSAEMDALLRGMLDRANAAEVLGAGSTPTPTTSAAPTPATPPVTRRPAPAPARPRVGLVIDRNDFGDLGPVIAAPDDEDPIEEGRIR